MMNRVFKKIAIVVAAAAMTLTAVAPSAFASSAPVEQTLTVTLEDHIETLPIVKAKAVTYSVKACSGIYYVSNNIGLNVRQKPTQNSARLGGLQKGAKVQVTGKVYINGQFTGWVRINFNGQNAFVRNCLTTAKPATKTTKTVTNKKAYTVKVSQNYLALRTKPINARNYEKAKLSTGTKVILIKKTNTTFWYVYVSSTRAYGYVNHNFLV